MHFSSTSSDTKKRRIREIERHGASPDIERIIARALGLPDRFFRQSFFSVEEMLDAAARHWSSSKPLPTGFVRVDRQDLNPSYRREAFEILDEFARTGVEGNRSMVLVDGKSTIGKSYLVAQWYWSRGHIAFEEAHSIECMGLSLDQLSANIESRFGRSFSNRPRLLVLDGLRVTPEGGSWRLRIPGEKSVPFTHLLRSIRDIWEEFGPLSIVLGVENNSIGIERRELVAEVPKDALIWVHHLQPLTPEEGERFLYQRGATEASQRDRLTLAKRFGGLPGVLATVASELKHSDQNGIDRYIAEIHGATSEAIDFMTRWIDRHEAEERTQDGDNDDSDGGSHPRAVFRLLALMSGPVTQVELNELVVLQGIKRITPEAVTESALSKLPFVDSIESEGFFLHPALKHALKNELDHAIATGTFDQHTSLAELEAIHWRAARMRLRSLRRPDLPDASRIRLVESFVFHICEQIRLVPDGDQFRQSSHILTTQLSPENWTQFDEGPGLLTTGKLWLLAFEVVKLYLLDKHRAATRVFGQYEAKGRILRALFQIARAANLRTDKDRQLLQEETVCWMHAGRLTIALEAVEKLELPKKIDLNDEAEWGRATTGVAIETAVRMRRGDLGLTEERLKPYVRAALSIAEKQENTGIRRIHVRERGAIKMMTRAAEHALLSGEIDLCLRYFDQARTLQSLYGSGLLTGQAARRYAQALIRARKERASAIEEAARLLGDNVDRLSEYAQEYKLPVSADVVSFRTMQASIHRIAGNFEAAEAHLKEVTEEPAMIRGETNFLTLSEFDLEKLRLAVINGQNDGELVSRISRFAARMLDHGHHLMRIDALLLGCELKGSDDREEDLKFIEKLCNSHAYSLRLDDIALLRKQASPLAEYGV